MAFVDNSALSVRLRENVADYQKIFSLKIANGFGQIANTLTTLGIDQKVSLKRNELANITQPGRTNAINNKDNFLTHKERIGELKPAKVDLLLNEQTLYSMRTSFLNSIGSANPEDIFSIAGREYIMSNVYAQIGKEVVGGLYKSALGFAAVGNSTAWQGGLNLFDGFGLKFTQGYATSGTGWVGDIPGANKVGGTTLTSSNILAELEKMFDIIFSTPELREIALSGSPDDESALLLPPEWFVLIAKALDNLTYKTTKLVAPDPAGFHFIALPNVKIKMVNWLSGAGNMFWTPKNNLFYLHPLAGVESTSIKFQEEGRGIQILIDWEQAVDYADGRTIVLYN